MKVLSGPTEPNAAKARPEKGCVVTIGAFDGVHLGHRALIDRTRAKASELGAASAVVTFDRHPASVVRPESAPKLLTDLDLKLELLEATGVDYTLVISFDAARANEPAAKFVEETLVERLRMQAVVVGHDFHFGKERKGNVDLLRSMGTSLGFDVEQVEPVATGETRISSTEIRRALEAGDVRRAASMLGRDHEVGGLVIVGDGRGRELGYPTANVHVSQDVLLPGAGVYAGHYVFSGGATALAAISLGTRPTFHEEGVNLLEAHVLDFSGSLYGSHARVRFTRHLRDQVRYESVDELIEQMHTDVETVRFSLS